MATRRSYKKSPRLENDQYFTPSYMTRALMRRGFIDGLSVAAGATILEPCAGDRAISRILRAAGYHVRTNDFFLPGHDFQLDATLPASWDAFGAPGFIIGNPPFEHALPIIENAYERATCGVAMILRLSFAEPVNDPPRGSWLARHPYSLIVMPRHKWRKDRKGTDSVTAAWFLWDKLGRVIPNDTVTTDERDELKRIEHETSGSHNQNERDHRGSSVDPAEGTTGD